MNREIYIPASGAVQSVPLGPFKYLAIRSADLAFQISFDGSYWQNAKQNDRWDKSTSAPLLEKIYFRAFNALTANITIDYDTKPLGNQDTAVSSQLNTARGTGGSGIAISLNKAKAQGGADYVFNAGNPVDLTTAVTKIPGIVNGKTRKTIYFNNISSGNDVVIFDADGNLCNRIPAGKDTPVFETSSDFYIAGLGNGVNNFMYFETFYDKANS